MKSLLSVGLLLSLSIVLVYGRLFPIEYRVPLALGSFQQNHDDVWPKPFYLNFTSPDPVYTLEKARFHFSSNLDSCDIVHKALARYTDILFVDSRYRPDPKLTVIEQVEVHVTETGCGYPNHEEDESYQINVPASDNKNKAKIEAKSVWGALRALETFSQLVYVDDSTHQLKLRSVYINDVPRYKYRGVLFDTARHYLPKRILLANLDAMAFNKFNAFHWHLVDDQSFPFVSKKHPTISEKGAYTPKHIYTAADVQEIIEYARLRGIRVIPELDTPGHTHAMARAFPDLLTPCYSKDGKTAGVADFPHNSESELLNPLRNETYTFLTELFQEFKDTFKDQYIHLGMDEAFYACWATNPDIKDYMAKHGMGTNYHLLEQEYVEKTLVNVRNVGYKYIIWQDPVDNGVVLANDSIVAVWKDVNLDKTMDTWQNYIKRVAEKNYQIILSACWYLNYINYPYPGYDWEKYYECDPRNFDGTKEQKDLVIGGQANIWGEFVDHTNILSRFWPRASAVGERLWSEAAQTQDVDAARHRLDLQRCRMLRRNIPAAPILNGYCGDWEVDQVFDGPSTAGAFSPKTSWTLISSLILALMCMTLFMQ